MTTWPPSDAALNRAEFAKLNQRLGSLQEQIAAQNKKDADRKQRKQRVVDALAKLLKQGREIRDKVVYNNFSPQHVSDWEQSVARYLSENLGESFAVRFRDPTNQITLYPPGMFLSNCKP